MIMRIGKKLIAVSSFEEASKAHESMRTPLRIKPLPFAEILRDGAKIAEVSPNSKVWDKQGNLVYNPYA